MFQVQKEGSKHTIHGSFKKLDYFHINDTGVLELPKANEKMIKRLSEEHLIIDERNNPNALIDKSVVWIDHTALVNEDLIGYCKGVRMLMIENDCDSSEVMKLKLVNMTSLERIEIGKNCISKLTSFHVNHSPKLRRVFIGDGSFTNCTECVIEDNAELLELQLGGNADVSIPQQGENKKENTKNTKNSPGGVNDEKQIEQSKESKPDKPAEICKEPVEKLVLKLASCYYQQNSNE